MPNVNNDDEETLQFADESEYMEEPEEPDDDEIIRRHARLTNRAGLPSSHQDELSMDCRICHPLACDDPDKHLGVTSGYTPLKNLGCHCGADFDGRDCMCFE